MKKIILTALFLIAVVIMQATPVSGTFTIPSVEYPTIASAISALNTNGVSGPATFLINADYSESAINLILNVPSAGVSAPIIFKKNPAQTGANPKITALAGSAATTDGVIIIAGTDYVTFDKVDVDASSQNTVEWGYALVKQQNVAPYNGCQYVTINGCNITMNKAYTSTIGIYTGNHIATAVTALPITSRTDAHNNCNFDNNTISNTYMAIKMTGYSSAPSPYTLYDHFNGIGVNGKNYITNFGGSSAAVYVIQVSYQDSLRIMNDSIYGGIGSTDRLVGIYPSAGTSACLEIAYNTIVLTPSATATGKNTYAIWNFVGGTPASNYVRIHHNTFKNFSYTTASTGALYGVVNSAAADSVKIYNNDFYGFTLSGTGSMFPIRNESNANYLGIYNNNIYNNTCSATGSFYGMYISTGVTVNVFNNNIYNCGSNGGTVYGIEGLSGTNLNIYRNNLYNLSSNNSGAATATVYGIYNISNPNFTVYNNFISDLKANQATNNPAICGMYLAGGTSSKVYGNSIFMNASSTGSNFGTAGIYASTSLTLDLRNNIVCNISTPGASGMTVAYKRSTSTISTYAAGSNNNCFYAGTPGSFNMVYYDGANLFSAMSDFQSFVAPRDAASISTNPTFVNTTVAPYDLHMQTGIASPFESGGIAITTPVINDDFDGQPRFPNTGYPNNLYSPATAPDMGADEFAGGPAAPPTKTLNLTMLLEGLYAGSGSLNQANDGAGAHFGTGIADQITVELHNGITYSTLVYTTANVNLGTDGTASVSIPGSYGGSYYITIKHRNTIQTVSGAPVSFAAGTIAYNFSDNASRAYGNNMILSGDGRYLLYSGDVNQDDIVDGGDMSPVDNKSATFASGYIPEDINGDGLIDGSDMSFIDNNSAGFVTATFPN